MYNNTFVRVAYDVTCFILKPDSSKSAEEKNASIELKNHQCSHQLVFKRLEKCPRNHLVNKTT